MNGCEEGKTVRGDWTIRGAGDEAVDGVGGGVDGVD